MVKPWLRNKPPAATTADENTSQGFGALVDKLRADVQHELGVMRAEFEQQIALVRANHAAALDSVTSELAALRLAVDHMYDRALSDDEDTADLTEESTETAPAPAKRGSGTAKTRRSK